MIRTLLPKPDLPAATTAELADRLDEIAELLDAQQANPYRAQAYRTAAETVRGLHGRCTTSWPPRERTG